MAATTRKSSRAGGDQVSEVRPRPESKQSGSTKTVNHRSKRAKLASILLKHVSDPTRLLVILILADGEQNVGALCSQLGESQPAVSHHLALLRHGGIIAPRRQGKNNFYSLTETGADLASVVEGLMADEGKDGRPRPARRDGSEEEPWGVMNRRRAELIFKKNRGALEDAERPELERLQSISRARMHREFQGPSLIDEKLKEIEETLRGGGVGEK